MSEPRHKRYESEQEVGTPPEFIAAIERRWGKITLDLAASDKFHVCDNYLTPEIDALSGPWPAGLLFCNPPYGNITPWVKKARFESGPSKTVLVLVPAGIETKWFRAWVYTHAKVHILVPRLKFVGHDSGFTKGLVLCEYSDGLQVDNCNYYWHWKSASSGERLGV